MSIYSALIPDELQEPLRRLWGLWSTVQPPLLRTTGALGEFLRGQLGLFDRFLPDPAGYFNSFERVAMNWSGYGVNLERNIPRLALFFTGEVGDMLSYFPDWVRNLGPELVPRLDFRAIGGPPAVITPLAATTASPGMTIEWRGTGCTPVGSGSGTLGAFLVGTSQKTWILSANHVMSRNQICSSNSLSIPGIGVVSSDIRPVLIKSRRNLADVAVAKWRGGPINPQIQGLTPLIAPPPTQVTNTGSQVSKLGAMTRMTGGNIAYAAQAIRAFAFDSFSHAEFLQQILIRGNGSPFSDDGDSGSLVVTSNGTNSTPLGVLAFNNAHVAQSPPEQFSAIAPWDHVISELERELQISFSLMTSATL